MDSNFSPNYVEYTYDKKAEGLILLGRILLIIGYIVFVGLFFFACYISRLVTLFALCPFVTWILIFFTWRLVSYDVYYTFEQGKLEIGKIRVRKSGRAKTPKISINSHNIIYIGLYNEEKSREVLSHIVPENYSERLSNENSLLVIYRDGNRDRAVIIEAIPQLLRLLKSFSREAYRVE